MNSIHKPKPYLFKRRWSMWLVHEHRDGGAVLKGEANWRTVAGVAFNLGRWGQHWFWRGER